MAKSGFATVVFVLVTLLWVGGSVYAADFCTAPVPPPPMNGTIATAEALRDAVARARDFIGQANLYENCLREVLQDAQTRGNGPAVEADIKKKIAANSHLKDKVSRSMTVTMTDYKKAHVN